MTTARRKHSHLSGAGLGGEGTTVGGWRIARARLKGGGLGGLGERGGEPSLWPDDVGLILAINSGEPS